MKKRYLLLAVGAVVLGFLITQILQNERATARARAQLLAVQDAQKQLAASAAKSRASATPASHRAQPAPSAEPPAPRRGGPMDWWAAMNRDPKLMQMGLRAIRGTVDSRFSSLFRQLKLSPKQIADFETLFVNQQMESMDIAQTASAQGLDPRNDPNIQAMMKKSQQELQDGETAILGDDGAKQVSDYLRRGAAMATAVSIASDTVGAGAPLTAVQLDQLTNLMASQSASYQSGGPALPNDMNRDAIYQQAQAILQPAQLASLKVWVNQPKFQAIKNSYLAQTGAGTASK